MKVKGEWLVNENGEIVKMTLREWIEYFQISPVKYTFKETGNTYDMYNSSVKKERNGYIDIFKRNGYGLAHNEIEAYLDKTFRTGNADFDVKLVECI